MQENELNLQELFLMFKSFILKNGWIFLAFFLLGILLGGYKFYKATNTYDTKFFAQSEVLPTELIHNEIVSLNELVGSENNSNLSNKLEIVPEEVENLSEIHYTNVSVSEGIFIITVSAHTDSLLNEKVINGLQYYFSNNPYIKKYIDDKKLMLTEKIAVYKNELEKLSKLQASLLSETSAKNKSVILDNPSAISTLQINVKTSLLENQLKLEKLKPFVLIDAVHVVEHPSLLKILLTSIIVCLFLGFICVIVINIFTA